MAIDVTTRQGNEKKEELVTRDFLGSNSGCVDERELWARKLELLVLNFLLTIDFILFYFKILLGSRDLRSCHEITKKISTDFPFILKKRKRNILIF